MKSKKIVSPNITFYHSTNENHIYWKYFIWRGNLDIFTANFLQPYQFIVCIAWLERYACSARRLSPGDRSRYGDSTSPPVPARTFRTEEIHFISFCVVETNVWNAWVVEHMLDHVPVYVSSDLPYSGRLNLHIIVTCRGVSTGVAGGVSI